MGLPIGARLSIPSVFPVEDFPVRKSNRAGADILSPNERTATSAGDQAFQFQHADRAEHSGNR